MKLSVLIPTYNRRDILEKCLTPLCNQSLSNDHFDIHIIDDGSTDDTSTYVKKTQQSFSNIHYWPQNHLGPSACRNIGIKKATGDIILFIDDDVIASKDLLEKHLLYHDQSTKPLLLLGYVEFAKSLNITQLMKYVDQNGLQFGFNQISDPHNVDHWFCYTANLSGPKSIFNDALFDENFPYAAWEDIEMGYRIQKKGIKLHYLKDAYAEHYSNMTFNRLKSKMKQGSESWIYFCRKHSLPFPETLSFIQSSKILTELIFYKFLYTFNHLFFEDYTSRFVKWHRNQGYLQGLKKYSHPNS